MCGHDILGDSVHGAPFPQSEYKRRPRNILEAMAARSWSQPMAIYDISGQEGTGAYLMPLPGLAPKYVVREDELNSVRAERCIDELVG